MRINVYAEELTTETEVVRKIVDGRHFYGIRLFLKSPDDLHYTGDDDDRSAITFWVPFFQGRNHFDWPREIFKALASTTEIAAAEDNHALPG
jgi:hypothetical protein